MSLSERFYYERREGAKENTVKNILDLLEDYGEISGELKEQLNSIDDMDLIGTSQRQPLKLDFTSNARGCLF